MSYKKWWVLALGFCLLVATISPLASSSPDGLEKVAGDNGFLDVAQGSSFQVIVDYVFPRIQNEAFATILAGWIGVIVMFGVAYGISWLVQSRKKKATG